MVIDELIYIKGRRSIGIHIKDGRVVVRAPKGIPESKLYSVLKDKEDWVNKKVAEYNLCTERNREIIEYRKYLLFGEIYDGLDALYNKIALITQNAQRRTRNAGKDLAKLAAAHLPDITDKLSQENGLKYNSLKIIRSKLKWGSCTAKGVVSLNWRLIMLPPEIVEYVILHELCHIKHLNHSAQYWRTLESFYPKVKTAKQYLKENNFIIKLF